MSVHTIVLAAGEGSRMKSKKAKSLQRIGGTSMLHKICTTAGKISPKITLVVGFDQDSVIKEANEYNLEISIAQQPKAIGTGDAVKCGLTQVEKESKVLVLYGDVPLIQEDTLRKLIETSDDSLSILTTVLDNPYGYGRVAKDDSGNALSIVEEKDATDVERKINEIFTGVLCGPKSLLDEGLSIINNNNAAGEYYLTDLISIINEKGYKIKTHEASNNEVKGANNKAELVELEALYRDMKAQDLINNGVTVADPSRLDVRGDVQAGNDCSIDVNVILEGNIILGDNVSIGANTILKNTTIGSDTKIEPFSHIDQAMIGSNCVIGPYARLREGSQIENSAKVGNFVETKNSTLGEGSKANHFTYLGDTEVGKSTNIGAGTITCNYDGTNKHKTSIGDDSFIGSNTALVAPVTVGSNATVAAGSVITKDIPDNGLGVARGKQNNKENWSKKKD
ncbi:bifunctional UDP-N-acetylglucosamine diphosphorylase/glucosamine-1-phosphate N-acetyltransferase GlmU [Gammaproteobacteria bacterium]|nr:bifunctional UDP-N-acetylglucosamine diphosphorylase/glucosamine-1-phosphate N-acetyltransferase GlmU [Gammaproteobacteria bacterium]MDA9804716.1 bifunctional UDP-N-acetylglucosamine diphosphorylase/glucosamine-1-phosphate N-acetyltransferase GlmU [Gammaproteobacteria bacterium]